MWVEAWKLKEEEIKNKKITEKEKKINNEKKLEFKKNKEKIIYSEKSEKELFELKNLLDINDIDPKTKILIEKVSGSDIIWEEEIKEIFEKIDEIENSEKIFTYLPKEFRITKDEYKKSLTNKIIRIKTITKLNTALAILSDHINPDSSLWMNLFSGFMLLLDKNLIIIQESNIDIKDSLEKIEEWQKNKKQKTFWEIIKDLFNKLC